MCAKIIIDRDYDKSYIGDKKLIINGENHFDAINFLRRLIEDFKPDFFLTEHIQFDRLYSKKEIETRLKNLGKDGKLYNIFTKDFLTMLLDYDVSVIGCDYIPPDNVKDRNKDFEYTVYEMDIIESFILRENQMVKTIEEFRKQGRVLASLGDTHLRRSKSEYLGPGSPIYHSYIGDKDCLMIRLNQGKREID